jgi:CBS domain-containing protein
MTRYAMDETPVLTLEAKTAAEMMAPNVVSVPDTATVPEVVALLIEKRISAVPVLDKTGQPAGVVSLSDIVAHDREQYAHLQAGQECYQKNEFILRLKETRPGVFNVEQTKVDPGGPVLVRDIMTPVTYSVAQTTPASTVVDAMLALGVHRLFVTKEDGEIVGVISTLDVLRHLHRPPDYLQEPSDEMEALCGAE